MAMRKATLASDINEFALREVGGFVKKLDTYSELLKTHPRARLAGSRLWLLGNWSFP